MKQLPRWITAALAFSALACVVSCELDSGDEYYREVTVNFSGFYRNPNGGNIVSANSGNGISSLDLRQTGDSLEAVDNNGSIWKGSLGEVENGTTSFQLDGRTTSGTEGTFSGTLQSSDGGTASSGSVSNAKGTMQGTFVEPNRYATFYATATIPGATDTGDGGGDDGGDGTVSISPSTATLSANNQTLEFTASGGSGQYTWSLSAPSRGTLNTTSGKTVTYTRTASDNNTIKVQDSVNPSASASVTITQP